jgi:hypothetical protein
MKVGVKKTKEREFPDGGEFIVWSTAVPTLIE